MGLTQANLMLNEYKGTPLVFQAANGAAQQPAAPGAGASAPASSNTTAKFQATVQDVSDDLKRLNCILYDEMTVFNIQGLESNVSYTYGDYSVSFCRPISLNNKTGYVFDANTLIADSSSRPSNIQTVQQEDSSKPATHLTFD